MFRQLITPALLAGFLAAIVLTLVQSLWVTPLILTAETFETTSETASETTDAHAYEVHEHTHEHEHAHEHHHTETAWAPDDGRQRTLATAASNLTMAVGFALMLVALFRWRQPTHRWSGLGWGAAGFAVFFIAPALGLPPELPGTAAAELGARQEWWLGTASATAIALTLLLWRKEKERTKEARTDVGRSHVERQNVRRPTWLLKIIGAALLIAPHVIGAPQPAAHNALAPQVLQQQFVLASAGTNALFWVALGTLAVWFYRRANAEEQA